MGDKALRFKRLKSYLESRLTASPAESQAEVGSKN